MRTVLTLFFLLFAFQTNPDYAIENIRPVRLSGDGNRVQVAFDVVNQGGPTSVLATVRLTNKDSGVILASDTLAPLAAGEGITITLSFPVGQLPADSPQNMLLSVGIDEVEPSTGDIANNSSNVLIPPFAQIEREPTPAPPAFDLRDLVPLGFNLDDPVHVVALVGSMIAILFIIILMLIALRLLFRRPNTFEVLPPPYVNVPLMAPVTNAGRRQGWQMHAQNDLPPPNLSEPGATHIRKRLTGVDNVKFSNWQITGVRLSQYDQYGRVARSEVLSPRKHNRRLSRLAARKLTEDQLQRRLRPVARVLAQRFRRKINPRSAMLPVALDVTFAGGHGEVRILFELYSLEDDGWRCVDVWEPDMMVTGKLIHENFTYTLHGMRQDERLGDFIKRLRADLTRLLAAMLAVDPVKDYSSEEGG
jgi:hypothetical protein